VKELLKKGSTIIVLGPGGVGKTTIAAALGLAAAASELNTAVITVDPTRRLRDALGLERLHGQPTRLDPKRLAEAGLDPSLQLSAMVLDVKGTWDALVERFVASPAARRRILDNSFYRSLTEQFAGAEAYAALGQLYDLHEANRFALEVVDTPPVEHAFEFIQAPAHLIRLLDSRAGRWLFTPHLSAGGAAVKFLGQAARFVVSELERFAGVSVLSSISDFFVTAAEAVDSITNRLRKTEVLLRSPTVHFIMVTTPAEDRLREARELVKEVEAEGLRLDAIVVNRFLDERTWEALVRAPGRNPEHLDEIARLRAALGKDLPADHGLCAVVEYLENYRRRVYEDTGRASRFARQLPGRVDLALVPEINFGVRDLAALARLAGALTEAIAGRKALAAERVAGQKRRAPSSERALRN
jgi:anion-transporting  ArsA/GET3 family ATPase